MEVRMGVVRGVRWTATAYGNKDSVWTVHVLTFLIDSQAVELSMPSLPHVEDGDDVAVAGDLSNGILYARAFLNRTNGTSGRWLPQFGGWDWFLVVVLILAAVGLLLALGLGGLCFSFGCVTLATMIVFGSLRKYREDTRTSHAHALVNGGAPGPAAGGGTLVSWGAGWIVKIVIATVLFLALVIVLGLLVPRPQPRNPFGVADVPDPTCDAVQAFAATAALAGDGGDANAEPWVGKVADGRKGSLDGEWQSRWNEPGTRWSAAATAEVRTVKGRVYILYKEANGYAYVFDCGRQGGNRLVGKYLNLQDGRDAYPWAGTIVDDERIDGVWMRGRWDFRRQLKK